MGDDDKPFACAAQGCGMRFTNEDHLTVHKKKHEMSLNLTPGATIKSSNLFVDQTPTPTRFIRNCEEVGLFQDLQNVNPFEEQFRKAAEAAKAGAVNMTDSLNSAGSDPDTLNTPSVLPSSLDNCSDLVVSTTTCTDSVDLPLPISHADPAIPHSRSASSLQPSSTTTDSDEDEVAIISTSLALDTSSSPSDSVVTSNSFLSCSPSVITSLKASRAITTTASVTQSSLVTTATTSPTRVIQMPVAANPAESPAAANTSMSQSQPIPVIASAATVVQLVLKLPDGRSIPVQIPAVPMVPTIATGPLAVSTSPQPSTLATSGITSFAKLKLKQALTQNHQETTSNNSGSGNMRIMTEAVDLVSTLRTKYESSNESLSPTDSIQGHSFNSKRRRTSEEDPDEKRRRFLERNRAAATRCRLKRKQWIQSLEGKAEELSSTNMQLQNEVSLLRNEVAQLKSMLLEHKDCPITLQQRELSQAEGILPHKL